MNKQVKNTIGISFMILAFIFGVISESKKGVEVNYFVSVSFVCFLIGIYLLINTNKK